MSDSMYEPIDEVIFYPVALDKDQMQVIMRGPSPAEPLYGKMYFNGKQVAEIHAVDVELAKSVGLEVPGTMSHWLNNNFHLAITFGEVKPSALVKLMEGPKRAYPKYISGTFSYRCPHCQVNSSISTQMECTE